MVSALLKHSCSLGQACGKQWSAMHEAAKQGRKDLVALLLRHGGSVHLRDGFGVTPLGVAAEFGHCDVLEHLIHKGTRRGTCPAPDVFCSLPPGLRCVSWV